MKIDMTEDGDVVNGNFDYTNVNILNNIKRQLDIKQFSDSKECQEKRKKVITKKNIHHSDKSYIKMTIQKIIKDKVMEIQSFDTGQLKAKLIRMEEENFSLRNQTLVLEERIKYLENKCRSKNINIDEEEDEDESFNIRIDSDVENENENEKKTTSPKNEEELSPPGEMTMIKDEHVVIKQENDIAESTASTESTETTSTTESPQTESNFSQSPETSKQSEIEQDDEEVKPELHIKEETKEVIDLEILPDELIAPRESTSSSDNMSPPVSPRPRPRNFDSPNNGYKSRDVIAKYSIGSTRETSASGMNRPIPSLVPISLLNSTPYENRNSVSKGSIPNSNVELYEKKLLGQITSSPTSNKRVNMETQGPGHREYSYSKADNLLVRTARDYFKLQNDNSLPRIVEYGQLKQLPPQGKTEASIYTNTARDDIVVRYSGDFNDKPMRMSQEQQSNYKTYDAIGRHSDLINEKRNTFVNGYPSQQTMQRKMVPYTYSNTNAKYDGPKPHLSPMELQRYEKNRNLDTYVTSPNGLPKPPLKRPPSGYLSERNEGYPPYEPLSKVSSKPPPLIPGHNINPQQMSRFSSARPGNNTREQQHGPQKYQQGLKSSVAKYNISATNFHATSRVPSSYQMTNPYMESPTSYPSDFDTRLALPQLLAHITSDKSSIIFTWDKMNNASHVFIDNVDVYFLFAFHTLDLNQPPPKESTYWKRISIVNPLPLPIACTLTQSFDGQNYFFAVAAVNRAGVVGQLSNPCALKVAL